ncbi:MAG: LysR family transcriptional regulator [Alphaproteobacteria bacterium]|nr:LysR family transcriptional regulator [Alphaproteobacteria bacterium]
MLSLLPQTFVTIVESGSITGAADALNLAKSAVSQNLKRLEEQLGVKLAVRTTRRFSLTPAGERYYRKCKDIIALSESAKTEMEAYGATPSGPLSITAPHALVTPVVAPAVAEVAQAFPLLRPRIIADDARLDLVAEGIDLSLFVGDLPDSSLKALRVGELRDILCVSPDLANTAPSSDDPAFASWAQSLPYVAHVREPAVVTHRVPKTDSARPITLTFEPHMRGNTIEAIAALARTGLGVALLPDIAVAADLKAGRLVNLCGSLAPNPTPIYAVHAYDVLVPKSVRLTIKAIRNALSRAAAQ